jgi:hypothetical protein
MLDNMVIGFAVIYEEVMASAMGPTWEQGTAGSGPAPDGIIREVAVARRHCVLDPLKKRTLGPRAGGPSDLLSLFDKDEARYAFNAEAGGQCVLGFRFKRAETQVRLDLGRYGRKPGGIWRHGPHHPAQKSIRKGMPTESVLSSARLPECGKSQ